jgi:hypothetical protein
MPYADVEFYQDVYLGSPAPSDAVLSRYLQRASDDIEAVCMDGIDTSELNDTALLWLKKATCARTEQYIFAGTDDPNDARDGSLGSFSVSGNDMSESAGGLPLNTRCKMFLVHTGLMSRCVGGIRYEAYP